MTSHLNSHYFISFLENHFIDASERAASNLAEITKIVRCEIINLCAAELQLARLMCLKSFPTKNIR